MMRSIARAMAVAGRTPATQRNAIIMGVAVLAHGIVIGALATRMIEPPVTRAAPPPLFLDIEPRHLMPTERPRASQASAPERVRPQAPASATSTPVMPRPAPLDDDDAQTAAAQGVDPLWQVRPETASARAARAMRAAGFGCHPPGRELTADERASCDRRLAEASGSAVTGSGDAARDRRFAQQGAAAIARYEAQRAPLSGGVGVVGPADCVGSNLGMGCAGSHLEPSLRQDGDNLLRQPSNKLRPVQPAPRD